MAINKIKLKQIDADFPALVGQYGSGYFVSKNADNLISGENQFFGNTTFSISNIAFQNDTIEFGECDFTFDQNSLVNLTESIGSGFVKTYGNQSISGIKTFINGIKVGENGGTGVLYSGQINPVYVSGVSSNLERYLIFGESSVNGFKGMQIESGLNYNPSSKILKASIFSGNFSGLASRSTDSSNVYTSGNQNTNAEMYPAFAAGTGSQFQGLSVNSGLSYNPSVGAFKARIFSGNLSGTASEATKVYISGNQGINAQMYPAFAAGTGSQSHGLSVNSGLSYNPSVGVFKAQIFSGNLSGTASSATSATRLSGKDPIAKINGTGFDGSIDIIVYPTGSLDTATNAARYLLFTTTNANGYKDIGFSNITTNPASNSISASTFIGGFSGNSLNASSSTPLNIGAFSSGDSINFNFTPSTPNYTINTGYFGPVGTTAIKNLGSPSVVWKEVYASVGSINTSDRNLKTDISEIPDSWLDAWEEVNYVRYKFKDAVVQKGLSGARWHIGHIAQNIYETFKERGLDAFNLGMLCYDKWNESVDQNGNLTPSGEIWSIRPDECQFMELALMRRSINRLKSGILI